MLLLALAYVFATDPTPICFPAPTAEQSALIDRLNHDSSKVRHDAQQKLAAMGHKAVRALKEARLRQKDNVEVTQRINQLIDRCFQVGPKHDWWPSIFAMSEPEAREWYIGVWITNNRSADYMFRDDYYAELATQNMIAAKLRFGVPRARLQALLDKMEEAEVNWPDDIQIGPYLNR